MENKNSQLATKDQVKSILSSELFKKRFTEILGQKAPGFISSVINLTNNFPQNTDYNSIIQGAIIAATLDLPVDKNLGFSYLIPYSGKCQFQIGYKGLIQLALRTGQYLKINVIEIFENQLKSFNPLTEEIEFDFSQPSKGKIEGYACYFKLVNGFEKTTYWSKEKVISHGKRFSKTYNIGPWQSDFDEMAKKTVLKNTLSKWGILSIEMQKAVKFDQAIIKDAITEDINYSDASSDIESLTENLPKTGTKREAKQESLKLE